MAAAASESISSAFTLETAPIHHKLLLDVITILTMNLSRLENTHFYITGGAATAYYLPEKNYPINDIDCVCVINPTLSEDDFIYARNKAINYTKLIVKYLLENLPAEKAAELIRELPDQGASLTKYPYRVTPSNKNNYHQNSSNSVKIPDSTPFTGFEYYDELAKVRIISIRHRIYPYRTGLVDISFPSRDYPRIVDKWNEKINMMTLMDTTVPVISIEDLIKDQKYAAEHNSRKNKQERRIRRVSNLQEQLNKYKKLQHTNS